MMSHIRMVSGTAMEVAAVAIAEMRHGRMSTNDAIWHLRRAERREWAREGKLTSSSSFAHAVPIGVFMVSFVYPFGVMPDIADLIDRNTTSGHELWFSGEDGSAFISFEDRDDAVMFELALTGDRT